MEHLLSIALAAYIVATIHSILAFIYKRRATEYIAYLATILGFTVHTISLINDWIRDGRYPLLYLDETFSFLGWTILVVYGLVTYRYNIQALSIFTLPMVTLLTVLANITRSPATMTSNTVIDGAASWIFPVHTTLLLFAYASFFVAFVASLMYLWQERALKMKTFSGVFHRFPSLVTIDDIGSASTGIGFTLLTLGMVTGMLWSSWRFGYLWHNSPKEFFALVTWLLYLTLVHYRYTSKWRGRKAAWLGVVGFALVLCTFLGTRLLGGFHVFG
jgi:cytochrome c-type biogenesis protein CcsB